MSEVAAPRVSNTIKTCLIARDTIRFCRHLSIHCGGKLIAFAGSGYTVCLTF